MDWKKVTLFISSTFNDMHCERDYLVKNVFPELKDWCEERKIHLVDVDLRWGVTEKDTENANTVRTCLKNIDESRPFFLCFLGQRRGWVPPKDEINLETIEDYPKIEERIGKKSVTELEVDHALLSPLCENQKENCLPVKHALFFFRDPNYLKYLNEEQKEIYTNIKCKDNELLKEIQNNERVSYVDKKLEEYKEEIIAKSYEKDSRSRLNFYIGNWEEEYIVPELAHMGEKVATGGFTDFNIANDTLKDVILKQLKEEIANAFQKNMEIKETSDLQKELDQQDLFRENNTQGFIARKESFQQLDDFLYKDKNSLSFLTAEAGLGKTMLLANYSKTLKKRIEDGKNFNLYTRFSGVSDKSGNTFDIWKSILEEAKIATPDKFNSLDDWIFNQEELQKNIDEVFEKLADKGKTVIIIDGINQLSNGLAMVKWLPHKIPASLKIILSFKTEDNEELIENIKNNDNVTNLEVQRLESVEDKKDIINKYLEQFLKALDDEQINQICEIEGSDNPLLLKILLTELKSHGQFETLEEQIANFPTNPESAFQKVLERLENEETYKEIDSEEITSLIFSLLSCARYGLSEDELIETINIYKEENNEETFPENELKDIIRLKIRQVKPFMKRSEGRYDYFYDSFKLGSFEKYKENQILLHKGLAKYFKKQADPKENLSFQGRKIRDFNELPYHLKKSKNISYLEEILSKYNWIKNKSELNNIFNTINDYSYIDGKNKENDHLYLIKNTLTMSTHILKENIKSLPSQLYGRLKNIEHPKIKKLLNEVEKNTNYPWLKPHHYMNTPTGPLKKTLTGHTSGVDSVCFSHDDRYVVSGSDDKSVRVWDWQTQEEITRLEGHTSRVRSVCFSHDDRYVVSGSDDKSVRVWDLETQEEITRLEGHTSWVSSVCFSHDDRYVVSGSGDMSVRVWDLETQEEITRLGGHTSWVRSVCFSHDDRYVVSGSGDESVRVWDLETQEEITKLEGHTDWVSSVCFSHDDKYVVSGSDDKSVCVWDLETQEEITKLEGHTDFVSSVCFSHDDKYVVSGSNDNTVRVWDLETQEEITRLEGHTRGVSSVCFSHDDRYVVSGSGDEFVCVWDLETQEEITRLGGHTRGVSSVCFSHDDRYVVSGLDDKSVRVWDLETQKEITKLEGHTSWVNSVCFSHDDRYVVSGSGDESVRVWDLETQEEITRLEGHTSRVRSVCFSHDDRYVVSGSGDEFVCVWDLEIQKEITRLEGHTDWVSSVCFSHDDRYVVSGSDDKSVRVWDLETRKEITRLGGHTRGVRSVCFSHDDRYVVSGSDDKSVRVWDLETRKEIIRLGGHTGGVRSVCFSHDDRYVVSGSDDKSVRVWDLGTQEEIIRLGGHTGGVRSVCFSHDDGYVVSGSGDMSVRVWDLGTQEEITRLGGHTDWVRSVCFSHDDRYVVSGSDDKSVRVWDLETQEEITRLGGHTSGVRSVCFSHDDRYVVSGSGDMSICVWDLETQEEITRLEGHTRGVSSVCFSHYDRYVVSGSRDESVCVWDLEAQEEITRLGGHTRGRRSVCFSHDDRYVVSGSGDESVRVWDLETQEEITRLEGHTSGVSSVCFSHDDRYVVSGSDDKSVRVWDWKMQKKLDNAIILLNTEKIIVSCAIPNNNPHIVVGASSGQILEYTIENLKLGIAIVTAHRDLDKQISVRCKYCSKVFNIVEDDLGNIVKCSYCNNELKVNDFTHNPIIIKKKRNLRF
ncbi:MAG: DUF4062 domain-containing protein [Methanobrevibacter sp.]|nr:DUF4062 domain-containing protein [Methanobrevibacter sp.]